MHCITWTKVQKCVTHLNETIKGSKLPKNELHYEGCPTKSQTILISNKLMNTCFTDFADV